MKAIIFVDLDDTIFQTKIKNQQGFIPVTTARNDKYTSYMTPSQSLLWDVFVNHESMKIIPVTLRGVKEYSNTQISKNPKVITSVLYFSGLITHNDYIDEAWANHIKNSFLTLSLPMGLVFQNLVSNLKKDVFHIELVDNFYISIKNLSENEDDAIKQNHALVKLIKTKIINDEYFLHVKQRNIIIIPNFLDKKNAVQYLINKYNPVLTIGAGDSLSDWGFMEICDYKLIPSDSQIESFLTTKIKDYNN